MGNLGRRGRQWTWICFQGLNIAAYELYHNNIYALVFAFAVITTYLYWNPDNIQSVGNKEVKPNE